MRSIRDSGGRRDDYRFEVLSKTIKVQWMQQLQQPIPVRLARFFHVTFHGDCCEGVSLLSVFFAVEPYGLRFIPAAIARRWSFWRQRCGKGCRSGRSIVVDPSCGASIEEVVVAGPGPDLLDIAVANVSRPMSVFGGQ